MTTFTRAASVGQRLLTLGYRQKAGEAAERLEVSERYAADLKRELAALRTSHEQELQSLRDAFAAKLERHRAAVHAQPVDDTVKYAILDAFKT